MYLENHYEDKETIQPLLTIEQSKILQEQIEENILNQFCSTSLSIEYLEYFPENDYIFNKNYNPMGSISCLALSIGTSSGSYTIPIKINADKLLHNNPNIDQDQHEKLVHVLKEQSSAFKWDY